MKILLATILLFPLSTMANWKAEVALGVDGETWKIEETKIEDGKEKLIELGKHYYLKLTLKKAEGIAIDVTYSLSEKKGKTETLLAKGQESIDQKASNEIYAKGELNQPNTIITLKLKNL